MLDLLNKIKISEEALMKAEERLIAVWNYEEPDSLPIIIDVPIPKDWPIFSYEEEFYDVRKMLINQLAQVYVHSKIKDDAMLTIRPNYGVGIIPSAFGCKVIVKGDNMPWTMPIIKEIEEVYEIELPDMRTSGLCGKVLEAIEFYKNILKDAGLSRYIHIYLADTQGPLDIAFILRGVRFYKDVFVHKREVRRLLKIATDAYIEFSKIMKDEIGEPYDEGYHMMIKMCKGGVRICEDVAVNLSPQAYLEFSKKYNEVAFKPFNGGYIHFCGKGHHILEYVVKTKGIRGLNLGNPEYYKLEELMNLLSKNKVCLIGWPIVWRSETGFVDTIKSLLRRLNIRTGIIFRVSAPDMDSARKILRKWREISKII